MKKNLVQKIIKNHLVSGTPKRGEAISVRVDQVLTQDATGTMAYLELEAMGIDRIKVPLAVAYVDHNMLQTSFRNPDDHRFLRTAAARYGAYFSKPGNGICHQVHLERFAAPGKILLGTDSHSPTAGGMGSIAIGVGGLDAATVMAGEPYSFTMPKVVGIRLEGELPRPWVTAMDVILEVLRRLTVKGGVGRVMEYTGPALKKLTLTERATITNMGAELGATTSIFPSDECTRKYLKAQGREKDWTALGPDEGASYDMEVSIDLSELEPLIAQPWSPDRVVKISEIEGLRVDQVCIGSCTNSSYPVMKSVASILKGRSVAPWCDLTINPGSKQVYEMIAAEGLTADMIGAGARMLESACGPCIGMGQTPGTEAVSVRSFNRNFRTRCGNPSARVFLANPVACAVIALKGEIVDPRNQGIELALVEEPERFNVNDNLILPPGEPSEKPEVLKGPNIKEVPIADPLKDEIRCEVLLKLDDNVTTDDILPAGSKILPFRSNIPAISEFTFENVDATFPERARKAGSGAIVGGENYGQGSSREHAAIAPMYLGLKVVLVKGFARIHRANLINFGILPLRFADPADAEKVAQGDALELKGVREAVGAGDVELEILNATKNVRVRAVEHFSEREAELLKAGGLLPYLKAKGKEK